MHKQDFGHGVREPIWQQNMNMNLSQNHFLLDKVNISLDVLRTLERKTVVRRLEDHDTKLSLSETLSQRS